MKSGNLNSWNALGHSRPVTGLLYTFSGIYSDVGEERMKGKTDGRNTRTLKLLDYYWDE